MTKVIMEVMSPAWQTLFAANGLNGFDDLWQRQMVQVQEPNTDRGGMSYVYRLELNSEQGPLDFYVKRQQNYNCQYWREPWRVHPVCEREWYNSLRLLREGIPAIEPVYYGRRRDDNGNLQAIFVTLGLKDFQPLSIWLKQDQSTSGQRQQVLQAVGAQVRQMHDRGMIHHCLYTNHVFIRQTAEGVACRFIDLEKLRPRWMAPRGKWRDFETLYNRGRGWDKQDWRWLLQGYLHELDWTDACANLEQKIARKFKTKH